MRKKLATFGLVLLAVLALTLSMPVAQITVPYTFTTTVPVSQLNSNLSTIASGALNRAGGTLTGNILANSGVTIDGVDVGALLSTSGDLDVDSIRLRNTGATSIDVDGGITAGSGNVAIVDTTGKIPAISSTYFSSLSGANLTGIPSNTGVTTTWTTPTYSGGNFTTNGAGGWTVDSGDVVAYRWVQIGKTMTVTVVLSGTTVTAATGTQLRVAIPNSSTAATTYNGVVIGLDNSTAFTGFWIVNGGDTYITVYKEATAAVAWTASANATQLRFTATFEVQ